VSRERAEDRLAILTRGIEILRFVARNRFGVTISDIVTQFEMHRRTIYRYLDALQNAGIRIHKSRKPGGKGCENIWKLVTPREHMERIGIL